jgi:uncharacterized membrane protein
VARPDLTSAPTAVHRKRLSFGEDFRRFFRSGLATLLPTLITLWLLVKIWEFLWETLGQHIIFTIRQIWYYLGQHGMVQDQPAAYIREYWSSDSMSTRVVGVLLAILLVYIVGVFVGNLIGRQFYRIAESAVLRIPLVRAVYPAVKQVTDFILSNKSNKFASSHVVACQPHEGGIWSIGLITGGGLKPLNDAAGEEMVTVFIPSTPTAFSGYVLVVPRRSVVELPMSVEEAMRLLVSGGVIVPDEQRTLPAASSEPLSEQSPLVASRTGDSSSAKPQAAG